METVQTNSAAGIAAITGGSITGTNAPYYLAKSAIPFIKCSSGTMGNNGALSAITALTRTYSNGAWLWLPAGAIAAGVPAAASWLWFVGSSTTAGTVYNSTYTTGVPTMGTQTAFSTTGPGAFTGVSTAVNGPQITVPAGALGPSGLIRSFMSAQQTNSAGTKTYQLLYSGTSGTAYINDAITTQNLYRVEAWIQNEGVTNVQKGSHSTVAETNGGLGQLGSGNLVTSAVDTTAATSLVHTLTGVAADNVILESWGHEITYGA
jgi:hypothetical protein